MGSDQGRKSSWLGSFLSQRHRLLSFLGAAAFLALSFFFFLPHDGQRNPLPSGTLLQVPVRASSSSRFPFVVVLVTPSPVQDPGTRYDRLAGIHSTWGTRQPAHVQVLCSTDNLSADSGKGTLPSSSFLVLPQEYGPKDNVGRIRWCLQQILLLHPTVDFVLVDNDHTYLVPENLLCFLAEKKEDARSKPLFLGHTLVVDGLAFNSGGAGFVLSRLAIIQLLEALERGEEEGGREGGAGAGGGGACRARNAWEATNAGVTLAKCLLSLGISPSDTKDEEGRERFHVYGPVREAEEKVDDWYISYHPEKEGGREGGCCARESISFHYVGPEEGKALFKVLYRKKEEGGREGGKEDEIEEEARKAWPKRKEEVGGYAALPEGGEGGGSPVWELVVRHLQVCRTEDEKEERS